MKLALLSESPADEVGVLVLAEAVLQTEVQRVHPHLRARGWPNVAQVLPAIVRHLHFKTDADGLIVVVDSDDTVVHTPAHEAEDYFHPQCRLCQLRAVFRRATKRLPPARGRDRVMRCVGLAVPAIEAWYLCGLDESVTEEAWTRGQEAGRAPYSRKDLKQRVYGTTRPSLQWEIYCALREVQRHRGDARRLEADFPGGFGALAHDLRQWQKQSQARPKPTRD